MGLFLYGMSAAGTIVADNGCGGHLRFILTKFKPWLEQTCEKALLLFYLLLSKDVGRVTNTHPPPPVS